MHSALIMANRFLEDLGRFKLEKKYTNGVSYRQQQQKKTSPSSYWEWPSTDNVRCSSEHIELNLIHISKPLVQNQEDSSSVKTESTTAESDDYCAKQQEQIESFTILEDSLSPISFIYCYWNKFPKHSQIIHASNRSVEYWNEAFSCPPGKEEERSKKNEQAKFVLSSTESSDSYRKWDAFPVPTTRCAACDHYWKWDSSSRPSSAKQQERNYLDSDMYWSWTKVSSLQQQTSDHYWNWDSSPPSSFPKQREGNYYDSDMYGNWKTIPFLQQQASDHYWNWDSSPASSSPKQQEDNHNDSEMYWIWTTITSLRQQTSDHYWNWDSSSRPSSPKQQEGDYYDSDMYWSWTTIPFLRQQASDHYWNWDSSPPSSSPKKQEGDYCDSDMYWSWTKIPSLQQQKSATGSQP